MRMEQLDKSARRELPIGVFDSGLGGISVLRELVRILPQEDFYYVGDNANAPYGTKSEEKIRELTLQRVGEMYDYGIKGLVVACNTATSAAIRVLRQLYPDLPMVGIEPALKPAVRAPLPQGNPKGETRRVIVMATPGTVHGKKYKLLLEQYKEEADILSLGCPGLMEYVERAELHSTSLRRYLEELLLPCQAREADAIVLGCTHYPFVRSMIREVAGGYPAIIDGSEGTAREIRRRLEEAELLKPEGGPGTNGAGSVTFHMTMPEKEPLARQLLDLGDL